MGIAADAADPTSDEMGVPRILALHEDRMTAKIDRWTLHSLTTRCLKSI